MSDSVTLPGTGAQIATDKVGGRDFQIIKLDLGGDGLSQSVEGALPVSDGGGSLTVDGTVSIGGAVSVGNFPVTQAVSAAALPLPDGAATETTLAALNAKVPAPGQATMAGSQPVTIASDQTAITVTEPALILTGAAAQTVTVANILEAAASATPTNVENYRSASVQVVSTGTGGTFIFEQSNDGTNWAALPVFNAALTNGAAIVGAITAAATAIVYTVPLRCRFFRLRIATTITGGAIQAFTRLSTEPWTPSVTRIASNNATDVLTNAQLLAGTNLAGDVGFQIRANNTGAAGVAAVMSAATPVATSIKASNGRVVGIFLQNSAAALRSFKMFNQTAVTLGTTAATFEIDIPAGQAVHITVPVGLAFSAGIQWAVTGAKGLTDNTGSLTVNDVSGFIAWA